MGSDWSNRVTANTSTEKDPGESWDQYYQRINGMKGVNAENIYAAKYAELQAQMDADKKKNDELAAQGLNPDGSPKSITYDALTDADGKLKSQYQLGAWKDVNADRSALDLYRQSAMRNAGDYSQATKLALEKQALGQADLADQAAQLQSNNLMDAMNNMARTGGLSSGARERMMANSYLQGLLQRQQVARQGATDKLGIIQNDETQRLQGLKDVQGMENTQADMSYKNQQAANDINKYNTDNYIKDNTNRNTFAMTQYQEQMKKWAAAKSSDAQAKASGGGGKK